MSTTKRYRGRVVIGGIIVSTVVAGILSTLPAAATNGPDNPGFTPASGVNAAWAHLSSAKKYDFPPGVALPEAPPSVLTTPGSFVQDGALEIVAAYYYVCAWEDDLASALDSGDVSAVAIAQQRLGEVAVLPEVKVHVKDLGWWKADILGRLADPKALRADVSNCTYYLEGTAK